MTRSSAGSSALPAEPWVRSFHSQNEIARPRTGVSAGVCHVARAHAPTATPSKPALPAMVWAKIGGRTRVPSGSLVETRPSTYGPSSGSSPRQSVRLPTGASHGGRDAPGAADDRPHTPDTLDTPSLEFASA